MEKRRVSVNDKSFDRAGITKDKEEAVCEYIWNGFEARAVHVRVEQFGGELESAPFIRISDDGTGIPFESLDSTFGAFLSSSKPVSSIRIKSQLNKGKGRFSYLAFASEAVWKTNYGSDGHLFEYEIKLNSNERHSYEVSERREANRQSITGTVVEIPLSTQGDQDILAFSRMKKRLLEEFAWYLYLNQDSGTELDYCGNILNYNDYIDSELSDKTTITIGEYQFTITIIVWNDKAGNSSKVYYLSSENTVENTENTSFNNNAASFYHAVFVKSSFFKQNQPVMTELEDRSYEENSPDERKVLVDLKKRIKRLIDATFHDFLARQANVRLDQLENNGAFPCFADDDIGRIKKRDFRRVAQELYCAEPKLFHNLKELQCKSFLGFLNLLLQSDERENLLLIVDSIVSLSSEDRNRFACILKRSKLEHIIDTMDMIQKRYQVVQTLREIVYEQGAFSNERDHIQKIIEQHYWLFGDEYYLMTADKTIQHSLEKYEKVLCCPQPDEHSLTPAEKRRRMDVFLYSSRLTENNTKEALVIELKAPSVPLTRDVFKQIEDYAYIVRKEKGFQSHDRLWRFYAVCSSVDDDVKTKYQNFLQHGRKCLAGIVDNFEIYALSWDDVFTAFELRHRFLLDKLRVDYENSISELDEPNDASKSSREYVERKARHLIDMQLLPTYNLQQ